MPLPCLKQEVHTDGCFINTRSQRALLINPKTGYGQWLKRSRGLLRLLKWFSTKEFHGKSLLIKAILSGINIYLCANVELAYLSLETVMVRAYFALG